LYRRVDKLVIFLKSEIILYFNIRTGENKFTNNSKYSKVSRQYLAVTAHSHTSSETKNIYPLTSLTVYDQRYFNPV